MRYKFMMHFNIFIIFKYDYLLKYSSFKNIAL